MIRYFQQQVLQPSQQVILQLLLQLQPLVYHQLLLTLEQDLMQLFVNNSIGNNAVLAINGTGGGDLLTASAAGTTKFNVNNNGNLQFKGSTAFTTTLTSLTGNDVTLTIPDTDTTDSFCLLTLANCTSGLSSKWDVNNGAIYPKQASVLDLLIGGSATTSAKFGILNVNGSASPIASLSATTASGGNGSGLVLNSATPSLQSLLNQTLTIGGSTTGGIAIVSTNPSNFTLTSDAAADDLTLALAGATDSSLV